MKVTIMRGSPGSGKSTYANSIKGTVVSADQFFIDATGVYNFDPRRLGEAHRWCMRRFIDLLAERACEHVVVDNTNINIEDIAPYVAVAEAFGAETTVVQVEPANQQVAAMRNIHGVPELKVMDMARRMKQVRLPTRWNVVIHNTP